MIELLDQLLLANLNAARVQLHGGVDLVGQGANVPLKTSLHVHITVVDIVV